jgi:hypothetical protein
METLSVWLELYKSFHQVAIQNVSTLDINEVCETVAMKIFQALVRHCPTSANQAVPLLKAVQSIIMLIPFSDICGTRRSSKSKSRYVFLPGNYAWKLEVRRRKLEDWHLFASFTVSLQKTFNTFTAKIDHSRFNNSCVRLPASTLVDLIFQSRCFSLGGKLVQQLQYI